MDIDETFQSGEMHHIDLTVFRTTDGTEILLNATSSDMHGLQA
jgi:hypothetical protein